MFSRDERAQIRAALKLWQTVARTSNTHPSEIPSVKAEFIVDGTMPLVDARVESLIDALEGEIVYTTVTLAAERYGMGKLRLKRQLDKSGLLPVPGSKVYSLSDIIFAVNEIRERDQRGPFG
jgi:hypothetical protein